MERLTYKQAYDKIIEAYFKDEIKPYEARFCFCGTLNNGDNSWFSSIEGNNGLHYSHIELKRLEIKFLITINRNTICTGGKLDDCKNDYKNILNHPKYEDALFAGMCAALDVLKQIHKERGEDVDEELKLTKRNLIPA